LPGFFLPKKGDTNYISYFFSRPTEPSAYKKAKKYFNFL